MLPHDAARCEGKGAGASGHQVFAECVNCQRRTAPRPAGQTWYMEPSPVFPCPNRIPVEVKE
jgi:hypothetical protein